MEDLNFSLLELEKNPRFLLEKDIKQVTISDKDYFSDKSRFLKLIKIIESIEDALLRLKKNCNFNMVIDNLLISIADN